MFQPTMAIFSWVVNRGKNSG